MLKVVLGLMLIFLVVVLVQFLVASRWRTCPKLTSPVLGKQGASPATVRFIPSLMACAVTMGDLVRRAEQKITSSWYLFQYDRPDDPQVVAQCIGTALASRETDIDVEFVVNRVFWIDTLCAYSSIDRLLDCWRQLGVKESQLNKVHWFVYTHYWFDNVHTKYFIRDGSEALLWSGGMDRLTSGEPGTRLETGLLIDGPVCNEVIVPDYLEHKRQAKEYRAKTIPAGTHVYLPIIPEGRLYRTHELDDVQVVTAPLRRSFWKTSRNSILVSRVVELILSAEHTLDIITPQFNDPCLWDACLRSRAQKRIMTQRNMDDFAATMQKYFVGNYTNTAFFEEVVRPRNDPHVQFRTVDAPGVHAKILILDGRVVITGSMNCTVFSTITSSEVMAIVESDDLASEVTDLFEQFWVLAKDY